MVEKQAQPEVLMSPIVAPAKPNVVPHDTLKDNDTEIKKQVVKPAVCQAKVNYVKYEQKSERDFYGNLLPK